MMSRRRGRLAALLVVALAVCGEALVYRATVRSFLPAFCMQHPEEYYQAFEYEKRGIAKKYGKLNRNDRSGICAYFSSGISAGLIDGHPDFEADGMGFDNGIGIKYGVSVNTTSSQTQVVQSGVPKPVYCSDSQRCGGVPGINGELVFATAGPQYFASWYNDDVRYNKRVGFAFELRSEDCETNNETEVCKFTFDSAEHDEFSLSQESDDFFGPLDMIVQGVNETTFPSFTTAPVWPLTTEEKKHKFWFTTEIHSFFQYRGDEEFSFSGDDDVWVFINGHLVVDLGGVHSIETETVTLKDIEQSAGLDVGEIYTFDLFHAERHTTQSNFKLTTTLVDVCNVLASGSLSLQFPFQNPSEDTEVQNTVHESASNGVSKLMSATSTTGQLPSLQLSKPELFISSGAFEDQGKMIVLAGPHNPSSSAFVFDTMQHNVGTGFVADFTFAFSEGGQTEGFAFLIHQRPGGLKNLPLSAGSKLGFAYYSNSIAVVFDLCADRDTKSPEEEGCSRRQVRLHYDDENPSNYNSVEESTLQVWDDLHYLYPGVEYKVSVQYLEKPDTLEVFINDSLYLRKSGFDIASILGGGRNAFLGFTTGTSANPGWVNITSWEVSTVTLDPARTVLSIPAAQQSSSAPQEVPADGKQRSSFSVVTKDRCDNVIQFGGFSDLMRAVFVEIPVQLSEWNQTLPNQLGYLSGDIFPLVSPAEIIDNGDGTYSAALSTTQVGMFELYICFGRICDLQVEFSPLANGPPSRRLGSRYLQQGGSSQVYVASVTLGNSSSSDAQFFHVPEATKMVPVKERPEKDLPGNEDTLETSKVPFKQVGIIGGVGFFLMAMFALIAVRVWRKWEKDKAYIEKGREHRLAKEPGSNGEDEYSLVGRMLARTRASLMRHKARTFKDSREVEITELEMESEQLRDEVRRQKIKNQREAADTMMAARPEMLAQRSKKQFRGSAAAQYESDSSDDE